MVWGSIAGAAISGGLSFLGAQRANRANESAVRAQMDFQRESYQNRYQWQMADMRAAGLNPILAYQQGAGPALQGSTYTAINELAGPAAAVNSAFANARTSQEISNLQTQNELIRAQTGNTLTDTYLKNTQAFLNSALTEQARSAANLSQAQREKIREEIKIVTERLAVAKTEAEYAQIEQELALDYPWLRRLGAALRELNPFLQKVKPR